VNKKPGAWFMDKRTLRKIINSPYLFEALGVPTRVKQYRFKVVYDIARDEILLKPRNLLWRAENATRAFVMNATVASSRFEKDSLEYEHGGEIFKAAVDAAREIHEELKRYFAGKPMPPPRFVERKIETDPANETPENIVHAHAYGKISEQEAIAEIQTMLGGKWEAWIDHDPVRGDFWQLFKNEGEK